MNAINFIQQHGVEKAREELKKLPNSDVTHMTSDARMFVDENNPLLDEFQRSQIKGLICIDDLKRLVESVDLVNSYGGVQEFEWEISSQDDLPEYCYRLRQAIDDYEAIGGEHV